MPRSIEFDEKGKVILTYRETPGVEPGRLSINDLKCGDILVWYFRNSDFISTAIQELSDSPFSHVGIYSGIYVGKHSSIDAGPNGVREDELKLPTDGYVQVMRKKGLTSEERAKVVAAAREFRNYDYATFDALTLPFRRRAYWQRWNPHPNERNGRADGAWLTRLGTRLIALRKRHPPTRKIFCSQMIVEAYSTVVNYGMEIVESGVFTPNDVAADYLFTNVGWLCTTDKPNWHPLDPLSPEPVGQRQWQSDLARILKRLRTGGK